MMMKMNACCTEYSNSNRTFSVCTSTYRTVPTCSIRFTPEDNKNHSNNNRSNMKDSSHHNSVIVSEYS